MFRGSSSSSVLYSLDVRLLASRRWVSGDVQSLKQLHSIRLQVPRALLRCFFCIPVPNGPLLSYNLYTALLMNFPETWSMRIMLWLVLSVTIALLDPSTWLCLPFLPRHHLLSNESLPLPKKAARTRFAIHYTQHSNQTDSASPFYSHKDENNFN